MKMKHLKHLLIASTVTALCACNNTKESPVSLQWEMVKNGAAPGFYESSFTITNTSTKPLESDWEIYYTQLSPRQVKVNEDSPVIIEMINAGYYKIAPSESWTPLAPGDSIKISYLNQGIFTQTLFTPKSPFFVTNNGTQISIPLSIAPFDRKEQWTVQGRIAPSYPDGEKVYADNQALETTYKIQTYDMLPSLKEVTPREGTSIISKDISLSVEDGFADEAKLLIQNLKEMGYNVTDKGQTVIALCHFPQNMHRPAQTDRPLRQTALHLRAGRGAHRRIPPARGGPRVALLRRKRAVDAQAGTRPGRGDGCRAEPQPSGHRIRPVADQAVDHGPRLGRQGAGGRHRLPDTLGRTAAAASRRHRRHGRRPVSLLHRQQPAPGRHGRRPGQRAGRRQEGRLEKRLAELGTVSAAASRTGDQISTEKPTVDLQRIKIILHFFAIFLQNNLRVSDFRPIFALAMKERRRSLIE